MLRYSAWGETLSKAAQVEVWVTARPKNGAENGGSARVKPFPIVGAFREFPHNYLRRLNEFAWDYRLRAPSRLSMIEHVRNHRLGLHVKALKVPARLMAWTGVHRPFEIRLNRLLLAHSRSSEAHERLRELRPSVVISTGPLRYEEPAVVGEAINLGIPVMALITSWDNVTTKGRILFGYDAYLVWSKQMKRELHYFYPHSQEVPVYVVGAPQFDVFFHKRFHQSRDEFCPAQGLDATKPYIVYALGSPNFLKEHHGAVEFTRRVSRGELGNTQVLVRPHPLFDNGQEAALLRGLGPHVVVQDTGQAGRPLTSRMQDENQIKEWVNTFRHAGVVVNLSSTVGIDAALIDKPVVNLDFDPEPGQPNQALVKDVNHVWSHFKPIAESGGMWLANDMDEVVHAVREYLSYPQLHREKRRWMAEYVCGYVDGKCGERVAEAILNFVNQVEPARCR